MLSFTIKQTKDIGKRSDPCWNKSILLKLMDSKNKGFYEYGLIPSDEPLKQHKEPIVDVEYAPTTVEKGRKKKKGKLFLKKTFCICFSNIEVGSNLINEKIKDDQKKGDQFKVKDKILFSNVEIEPEKVLSAMESMKSKSRLLICCSNVEVGVAKGHEKEGYTKPQ